MEGRGRLRIVPEHDGGVFLEDSDHFVDGPRLFGAILEPLHALEGAVEGRVRVVSRVFASVLHLAVGAVEEKEEVLRVRIVRDPAPEKDLRGATVHLVLKAVVVGRAILS